MLAPKLPSLFKASSSKSFSFKTRYYDQEKERREQLHEGIKTNIKFNRNHSQRKEKGRKRRIVFIIIILSLLAYTVIIN